MEVYIEKKDWDKIINYARCSSDKWGTEIGGMAVVLQDKDDDWKIQDPMIMKQEVSSALCELDKSELAVYYSKMAMKYKNHTMRFCWWHSHAKMAAFWSGTDTNTIDEYEDGDLSFALVVNVKEEYKCRVSVWKPWVMHEDVELNILSKDEDYKVPKKVRDEVEKFCEQPTTTCYNSIWGYNASRKYLNKDQATLFGETAGESEMRLISNAWVQLIEKVDEYNSAFIAGEYQYVKYAKNINDLNKRIKKANIPLEVELVPQGSFEDLLSYMPSDLISCLDPKYAHLDPSDALVDDWNKSFGVGGYHG
jgi:hypothetical protein